MPERSGFHRIKNNSEEEPLSTLGLCLDLVELNGPVTLQMSQFCGDTVGVKIPFGHAQIRFYDLL